MMYKLDYLDIEALNATLSVNVKVVPDTSPSRSNSRLPHPIPYQGSKRAMASQILPLIKKRHFRRLYEPFAGSAAITIAAASANFAREYIIGDSLAPLIGIWNEILFSPEQLAYAYERIWNGQLENDHSYYNQIRDEFNRSHDPALLLYLLVRCVKNSLRFNSRGAFNQSHDKRRLGMRPEKMRGEILEASYLLATRTTAVCADFECTLADCTKEDLVYMDPPYEGTTKGADKRYHQGLDRERLIAALAQLNQRGVPFILSYDGRCGDKTYGEELPEELNLTRIELNAGRSSQATLSGRSDITIESLYLSSSLIT
jgi:DNA adenine methylase